MKRLTLDNTAAAGAACAVLLVQSGPGLHLAVSGHVPFGWQVLLSTILAAAMLASALLIIFGTQLGWKIALAAELVALIWITCAALSHPVLLRDADLFLKAVEAVVVICFSYMRLFKA